MSHPHVDILRTLMAQANVPDAIHLAEYAQVPRREICRLQAGLIHNLSVEAVVHLADYFDLSVDEFLSQFLPTGFRPIEFIPRGTNSDHGDRGRIADYQATISTLEATIAALEKDLATLTQKHTQEVEQFQKDLNHQTLSYEQGIQELRMEYQRLETQLLDQQSAAEQQWQTEALNTLESWLLQWSAAAKAAQENPQFPAKTLVALAHPIGELLESWGVTAIGEVGETIAYEPKVHQLVNREPHLSPGVPVIIQNCGYRQGDRLLHRAKVLFQEDYENERSPEAAVNDGDIW